MQKIYLLNLIFLLSVSAYADNSIFYGEYTMTNTFFLGSTCEETRIVTLTIGDDLDKNRSSDNPGNDFYLFIPLAENTCTDSYIDDDGDPITVTTTISDDTINRHYVAEWDGNPFYIVDMTLSFDNNNNEIIISGTVTDDNECSGAISGTGSRNDSDSHPDSEKVSESESSSGCFIGTLSGWSHF